MTSTNTIEFLTSTAAQAGRLRRQAGYAAIGETVPTFVVHVETHNTGMQEIDADDATHAEHIVSNWIVNLGNKSARYHRVAADGSLVDSSAIFDFQSFAELEEIYE